MSVHLQLRMRERTSAGIHVMDALGGTRKPPGSGFLVSCGVSSKCSVVFAVSRFHKTIKIHCFLVPPSERVIPGVGGPCTLPAPLPPGSGSPVWGGSTLRACLVLLSHTRMESAIANSICKEVPSEGLKSQDLCLV